MTAARAAEIQAFGAIQEDDPVLQYRVRSHPTGGAAHQDTVRVLRRPVIRPDVQLLRLAIVMHGLPLEKEISLVPLFLCTQPSFVKLALIRLGNSCRLFSTGIETLF